MFGRGHSERSEGASLKRIEDKLDTLIVEVRDLRSRIAWMEAPAGYGLILPKGTKE